MYITWLNWPLKPESQKSPMKQQFNSPFCNKSTNCHNPMRTHYKETPATLNNLSTRLKVVITYLDPSSTSYACTIPSVYKLSRNYINDKISGGKFGS